MRSRNTLNVLVVHTPNIPRNARVTAALRRSHIAGDGGRNRRRTDAAMMMEPTPIREVMTG